MLVGIGYRKEVKGMFCKFCGKRVDPSAHVCPYCGEPQEARSGGNGFWDIFGQQKATPETAVVIRKDPPAVRREESSAPAKKSAIFPITFLAVILGIVCTLWMGAAELAALRNLAGEIHTAVQRNEASAQELVEKLEALQSAAAEADVADLPAEGTKAATVASAATGFLTEPHDACLQGEKATEEVIFLARVPEKKNDVSIWWEYKTENGLWHRVTEDDSVFYVDTHNGESEMRVKGMQGLEEMWFRCCVKRDEATSYSREVTVYRP